MRDAPFRHLVPSAGLHALRFAAAILLTAGSLGAQSQTGTISGRVTGETNAPLVGAQVRIVGTGLGTLTGDNGRYTLVNVPVAQYRLRAQMIGHRPVERPVTVTANQAATQDFTLKRQVLELDAVVVTGTAGAARQREVGNSISQIDLSKVQEPPTST